MYCLLAHVILVHWLAWTHPCLLHTCA
jgi:hypothetical protein